MSTPFVFWPFESKSGGFAFGWKSPCTVVVAGTSRFSNREDATAALLRLKQSIAHQDLPIPALELLGTLSGGDNGYPPESILWENEFVCSKQKCIVYYTRPKVRSMRHYSLVGVDLDLLLSIQATDQSPPLTTQQHEYLMSQAAFTMNRTSGQGGLDSSTINQLNAADWYMKRLAERGSYVESAKQNLPLFMCVQSAFKRSVQFLPGSLCLFRGHVNHCWGLGPYIHSVVASAQQLDLRCEQLIFILRQMWLLENTKEISTDELSANYISTQSCIWLILNDIIMGSAVGLFLIDNRNHMAQFVHHIGMMLTVDTIRSSIIWLDNWPAGLKLNTELSRFLYLILNAMIDMWEVTIDSTCVYLPTIMACIGISGILGLTMIVSFLSDLVSLMSIHLSVCYSLVRVAYRTQLLMIGSLFNLFRGKRYNALRRRLDDWDYDLDQLLLGTMLLTLTNFFFPTVTVYYVPFALSRLAVLMLQAGFEVALALLNHFPLFAITLRLKDPWRLPGGITMHPTRQTFIVQNSPIGLSKIFGQYFALGSRLGSHYSPKWMITSFLKGKRLASIPQSSIRYTYRYRKH